ncbi:MAG: UDP-2,3-diacylglucosamine diphosphatase [Pseudomonadota bacterium]
MTVKPTLFISDLHLHANDPAIGQQFADFAAGEARAAAALYILVDLFEAWIGDDDPDSHYQEAEAAITALARTVPVYVMHGNRDFLIGTAFAARTGATLLPDPYLTEFHGQRVLLSHGDAYCTDDTAYQAVRQQVRDPAWQASVLALPIPARQQLARDARAESQAANADKSMDIMDVNNGAIDTVMREHDVTLMLHGHTHRPAQHFFDLSDGRAARRMVLGDWYHQGSVGVWDSGGFSLQVRPRA